MLTHQYRNSNLRSCEVVFQRGGLDVETFYWAGPIEEIRELAEEIAFKGGADAFQILDVFGAENDGLSAPASDA